MSMHHTLGYAGGAGGREHSRRVISTGGVDLFLHVGSVLRIKGLTLFAKGVAGDQKIFAVITHASRIVIDNGPEHWTLRLYFQQLVDLLLVFYYRERHFRIVEKMHHLCCNGILVQGHWYRPEHLDCHHCRIQSRAVVSDNRYIVAALHSQFGQPAGEFT